jgi:arsenite methyltransferase
MATTIKPDYGIDAPGVIRNLLLIGAVIILGSLLFPQIRIGSALILTVYFLYPGAYFFLTGLLMLLYSLWGKYSHRDRMLNLIKWTGNENALDVGTGKGLLMIGAAKRLTTGIATGIDIWNASDLTDNNKDALLRNVSAEGVGARVAVKTANVMEMDFPDETFDVVVSNLCLHNIYNKEGRKTACSEIARVLKPGGVAVIADFRHVKQYKADFAALGLATDLNYSSWFVSFPPLTILRVVKAGPPGS